MAQPTYERLLNKALENMYLAAKRMTEATEPQTPLPRPKIFHITDKTSWPPLTKGNLMWHSFKLYNIEYDRSLCLDRPYIAQSLIKECKGQPRLVLLALRRIQAAAAWCDARAEGRRRQADEILRQQARAVEALETEAALLALGE